MAAIDFETTGLSAKSEEILEFAGVLFDPTTAAIIDTFSELTCPSRPIRKKITEITGLSRKDVKGCRRVDEVLSDFIYWVKRADILIAHNAPFDSSFLVSAMARHGISQFDIQIVDTLAWAREKMSVPNYKLRTLLAHIEASTDGLHRAAADSDGVRQLTQFLLKTETNPISELQNRATSLSAMGSRNKKSEVSNGPQRAAWESGDATAKQLGYLKGLGAKPHEITGLTKGQASALIQKYQNGPKSGCLGIVVALVTLCTFGIVLVLGSYGFNF